MIFNQYQRLLAELSAATRKAGMSTRMGTVAEVMQKGGEQKVRVEIGVRPDGTPELSPWINPTAHHSGASSEQKQYKKGQNVRISTIDGDYRQATVTAAPESTEHAPQPKNAPMHGYGDSSQVGGKLFTGKWGPDESEEGSGGQQGGGGGGGEKNHRQETWIASKDYAPPKHQGKSQKMNGGGQQAEAGGQKKQEENLEEAVMSSVDEKNGITHRIGKDVRLAAHSSGAKTVGGKTLFAAHKDKDAVMKAQQHGYVTAQKDVYVKAGDVPWVSKPWRLKGEDGSDGIPNDNKLGNGGTKGGHGQSGGQAQA